MIRYKETTSYEAEPGYEGEQCVKFRCPQCGELLEAEVDVLEGGFDVTCDNCNNVIRCFFKLVMEWD